jgi:hypothetical protein
MRTDKISKDKSDSFPCIINKVSRENEKKQST